MKKPFKTLCFYHLIVIAKIGVTDCPPTRGRIMPAQAGIQTSPTRLDSRLRENDKEAEAILCEYLQLDIRLRALE